MDLMSCPPSLGVPLSVQWFRSIRLECLGDRTWPFIRGFLGGPRLPTPIPSAFSAIFTNPCAKPALQAWEPETQALPRPEFRLRDRPAGPESARGDAKSCVSPRLRLGSLARAGPGRRLRA